MRKIGGGEEGLYLRLETRERVQTIGGGSMRHAHDRRRSTRMRGGAAVAATHLSSHICGGRRVVLLSDRVADAPPPCLGVRAQVEGRSFIDELNGTSTEDWSMSRLD